MSISILYTNGDAVRAALGAGVSEAPDALLTASGVEMELTTDLYTWLPTYPSVYAAGVAVGASAVDVWKKDNLILYCKWFCVWKMTEKSLLFKGAISNGKDKIERFKATDFSKVTALALGERNKYKAALAEAVLGTNRPAAFSLIGASIPDIDPVTTPPD